MEVSCSQPTNLHTISPSHESDHPRSRTQNSTPTTAQPPFSLLLSLPPELRNKIYTHILSTVEFRITIESRTGTPILRIGRPTPKKWRSVTRLSAFTLTCRQIYSETRFLPFAATTWVTPRHSIFEYKDGVGVQMGAKAFWSVLRGFDKTQVSKIERVRVRVLFYDYSDECMDGFLRNEEVYDVVLKKLVDESEEGGVPREMVERFREFVPVLSGVRSVRFVFTGIAGERVERLWGTVVMGFLGVAGVLREKGGGGGGGRYGFGMAKQVCGDTWDLSL
ncbi:unnamed protein product [Periconia digitata]|uniref:Uncharacterized protein n=1 Tax=Periconia digitata TaxID=1303443 RepID=A0A9W4U3M4_9PLEO|nr:unnamed protein product [Periconia digitata]